MNRKSEKQSEILKPGTRIKIYGLEHNEIQGGAPSVVCFKTWEVVKCYKYFVLMQDQYGVKECFRFLDLKRHMRPPKRIRRATGGMGWSWGETE